jgi:hypothetical protein
MTPNGRRRVTLRQKTETGEISLDILQEPGARQARGKIAMRAGGHRVAAGELGVLQVAPGWASFTSENLRAVIDTVNPIAQGTARVTVWRGDAEVPQVFTVDAASVRLTGPPK